VDRLDILAIDKVHSVGVNNSTVIVLALNFEVVRNEVDRTTGIHSVGRFEGRVAELATSTASAAAATSIALVSTAATTVVGAITTLTTAVLGAVILLVVVLMTTIPLISTLVVTLVIVTTTTSHVLLLLIAASLVVGLLLLLLPGLMASRVALVGPESSLVVGLLLLPAHVLLGGTLPGLLLILVLSRVAVVLLIVLHLQRLVVLISKTEARFLICFAVVKNEYLSGKSFSSGLLLACLVALRELS